MYKLVDEFNMTSDLCFNCDRPLDNKQITERYCIAMTQITTISLYPTLYIIPLNIIFMTIFCNIFVCILLEFRSFMLAMLFCGNVGSALKNVDSFH